MCSGPLYCNLQHLESAIGRPQQANIYHFSMFGKYFSRNSSVNISVNISNIYRQLFRLTYLPKMLKIFTTYGKYYFVNIWLLSKHFDFWVNIIKQKRFTQKMFTQELPMKNFSTIYIYIYQCTIELTNDID